MAPFLSRIPTRGILPLSPTDPNQVPVLFLHGILGSPGNFELPTTALAKHGRPFYAPAYGEHGTGALDISSHELLTYFDSLNVDKVDIVGHSAGGLLGLRLAQARPDKVRGLIGLGAAFRGVPRKIPLRPVVRMIGGEAVLQITKELPAEIPHGVRVISVISNADRIVPAASSELGQLVWIRGVRHEDLPRQTTVILRQLSDIAQG
ncbi:MAG: alpha/beta hydrolase [Corynebacterium sp.]|nr:alpha/beta hydrolase [Corynebacterium sp.]